ncbi:MAG: LAGLIDADG family homing endonuclease [Candidatus Aenigmatarchaeota archaeon]
MLRKLFLKYTDGVIVSPRKEGELRFYAYLDKTFDFLFQAKRNNEILRKFNKKEFLAFLAGFFDAEGSVVKRKLGKNVRYELKIGNTNRKILEIIKEKLEGIGIKSEIYTYCRKGRYHYLGDTKIVSKKSYYVLEIKRNKDVLNLLRLLKLKHKEKIARKNEAIEFLTKKNIINNYYFSLLYNRLSSLTRPKSVKEFAITNNLNYFTALSYLLHNRKREFIKKIGGKYIISKKGKDFINFYENALKSSPLHHG